MNYDSCQEIGCEGYTLTEWIPKWAIMTCDPRSSILQFEKESTAYDNNMKRRPKVRLSDTI